ncbi:hypothetical protein HBH72_248740 [Parastagonospora nodorum]|nr:hypothetical protein HBH72_248740 [Parastagonospora nodorum]
MIHKRHIRRADLSAVSYKCNAPVARPQVVSTHPTIDTDPAMRSTSVANSSSEEISDGDRESPVSKNSPPRRVTSTLRPGNGKVNRKTRFEVPEDDTDSAGTSDVRSRGSRSGTSPNKASNTYKTVVSATT